MSHRLGRQRALRDIARELADSDPRLDDLFFSFNLHVSGEEMPPAEKIKTGPRGWIAWIGQRMRPASADYQDVIAWHW